MCHFNLMENFSKFSCLHFDELERSKDQLKEFLSADEQIAWTNNRIIMEKLPKDRFNLVFWMVFLIGFTILLPWNILITVSGFWDYKFRNISQDGLNVENSTTTDLQKLFASYVAIASNVPNATFIILHALIGHKFPMKLRLFGSQVCFIRTSLSS